MVFDLWVYGKPIFTESDLITNTYHPHTLKEFKHVLTQEIPAHFEEQRKTTLPFPAWIVEDIDQKNINRIIKGLGWSNQPGQPKNAPGVVYHTLAAHFLALNEEFLSGQKPEGDKPNVEEIISRIKFLASEGVLKSALFFMTSFAWAHQNVRPHAMKLKSDAKSDLRRTETWALKKRKELGELLNSNSAEDGYSNRSIMKHTVQKRIKKKKPLEKALHDIDKIIEKTFQDVQSSSRQKEEEFKKKWPRQDANVRLVHRAYEGVVDLIGQGWKKHGAPSEATQLFQLWGIESMTPEASKKRRQRLSR